MAAATGRARHLGAALGALIAACDDARLAGAVTPLPVSHAETLPGTAPPLPR